MLLIIAGDPKGAMLTHKNYTATVAALSRHMQLLQIGPGDIIFSYLPLAHTFEQVRVLGDHQATLEIAAICHLRCLTHSDGIYFSHQVATNIMMAFGCAIGIFQGDMKLLMDDMATLKPTIFPTVPR